ncbi:hypothetical protein Tco_0726947 [Tanacetum coccineum]|uniref:Uncharacterized protein n=1 Tax=Tanacetum coccineum TaxID=301880 RepID=A0ABQ4YI33_9ASTR
MPVRSSMWVKKLFRVKKVANENDESGKNTAWVASEYIVSKSGIGCMPRRGSKKVVHTDIILGMDGPDGPSNANYVDQLSGTKAYNSQAHVKTHVVNDNFINLVKVSDENNKVHGVIDGEADDEIKNNEIGNKEDKVDNCDMNGSSAGKQGSRVMKANAVSSGKDDEKGCCGKKYRRRSFKLAKAGTRRKRRHSSSNDLGCNRNSLNGDTNEKGGGSVKTNVMGPTCYVSEGRLKKVGEQIGVVWNDMEETKISCVAVADIVTKGQ